MAINDRSSDSPPAGVSIEQLPRGARLRCDWFSLWAVGDLVAAIFIGGVLIRVGWPFREMLSTEHFAILGAVACTVGYYCLVRIVNSTTIKISGDKMRITHGPLPCRLGSTFPTRKLAGVRLVERAERLKNVGRVMRYWVWLSLKDGRQIKLLAGLHSRNRAVYVEQFFQELIAEIDAIDPFQTDHQGKLTIGS